MQRDASKTDGYFLVMKRILLSIQKKNTESPNRFSEKRLTIISPYEQLYFFGYDPVLKMWVIPDDIANK